MITVPGSSVSRHETCRRRTFRCFVKCKRPRRNCDRIEEWILAHGIESLPPRARDAPDEYFFYLGDPLEASP